MGKIFAFSNQKGGVGKTTSTLNLGAYLGEMGKSVLIVDLDPQGNLTSGVGVDAKESEYTSYQVLVGDSPAREVIVETNFPNLFLMPANIDLSAAELDLLEQASGREFNLKKALEPLQTSYDYIFIDCPPSLGILTINALSAADFVVIVLQCEYYALEGLSQLMKIIQKVQSSLNDRLELGGVLLTMFDSKTNLSKQVKDDVMEYFSDKVFESIIPRNVKVSEAPSFGEPIGVYDPKSAGAKSYEAFAKEFLARTT